MWKSRWNIKCSEARIHNHTQNVNTELKMMFRDTGSHLFHKFNMLLSITHDGDGQGHWQMLKEQSCSSEPSWLETREELVTEDALNSVVEAQVSLWKQRVNMQSTAMEQRELWWPKGKHTASIWQPGNTPVLLISDSGRKAVHQGFGKPSKN